jgi:hypothetical protein
VIKIFSRPTVLVEPSYSIFEEIGFGRLSFNGFNPVIEVSNFYSNNLKSVSF